MPYLVASDLPSEPAGQRFRALVERGGIAQLPGAHNGMAAIQARMAGFEGLYLSGAAMTASMGIPDLGMITVDEVAFFIRQIARASGLPLLVDGDTGYGEALNVMHMVRVFEEAGAGAVHIEDQLLPKKCGHLNDKKLAGADDMAAKVAAARKARKNLVIIARTDAAASEGIDGAVARARRYLDAGADAIFAYCEDGPEIYLHLESIDTVIPRDLQLLSLCTGDGELEERLGITHVRVHPDHAADLAFSVLDAAACDDTATPAVRTVELPWELVRGSSTR